MVAFVHIVPNAEEKILQFRDSVEIIDDMLLFFIKIEQIFKLGGMFENALDDLQCTVPVDGGVRQ